jgi:hypothetical protein
LDFLKYNASNDILRVTVPVDGLSEVVENFDIQFENTGEKQGAMKMAWDKTLITVPFKL